MTNCERIGAYAIEVAPVPADRGGGYEAVFPQVRRGVVGYGGTHQEAVAALLDAVPAFLEAVQEAGQPLPVPKLTDPNREFSGRFNVRVPKALHGKLVGLAEDQGVSLNSLVQAVLMAGATELAAAQPETQAEGRRPRRRSAPGRPARRLRSPQL